MRAGFDMCLRPLTVTQLTRGAFQAERANMTWTPLQMRQLSAKAADSSAAAALRELTRGARPS